MSAISVTDTSTGSASLNNCSVSGMYNLQFFSGSLYNKVAVRTFFTFSKFFKFQKVYLSSHIYIVIITVLIDI